MHAPREHNHGHTETRIVPVAVAETMRSIAEHAYPSLTVITVATGGHTFFREPPAHEVEDRSISIHVPLGCEAISVRWRSRGKKSPIGVPRSFYLAVSNGQTNPIQQTDSR